MRDFQAGRLEEQYAFIDEIPESLVDQVVAARGGSLQEIAKNVVRLRKALLEGRVPDEGQLSWPESELRRPLLEELDSLDVARFCEGQPDLADSLVSSLIETVEERRRAFSEVDIEEELEAFVRSARIERLKNSQVEAGMRKDERFDAFEASEYEEWVEWCEQLDAERLREFVEFENKTVRDLREEARQRARQEVIDDAVQEFHSQWAPLAEAWHQLAGVFTDLSELLGRGWDFARGIVEHDGWMDLVAMREFVEEIPELQELIRTLGRLQVADDEDESVSETIFESVRRSEQTKELKQTPRAPVETRGVRRSADITRMLPVEALKLTRPGLTRLFHARRFEHALATYRVEGVMPEHVETKEDIEQEIECERESPEKTRGPIIVCLDTSGSMKGTPERVAKALTLEAVRVAHQEGRRCFVYAFSGPGQVDEAEISLETEAFSDFLDFLRRSFHGGTDVEGPLERATDRLNRENWKKADLLLVSDGKFRVSDPVRSRVKNCREETGAKLHGVRVGGNAGDVMESLCDEFHCFEDWQALESARLG